MLQIWVCCCVNSLSNNFGMIKQHWRNTYIIIFTVPIAWFSGLICLIRNIHFANDITYLPNVVKLIDLTTSVLNNAIVSIHSRWQSICMAFTVSRASVVYSSGHLISPWFFRYMLLSLSCQCSIIIEKFELMKIYKETSALWRYVFRTMFGNKLDLNRHVP